MTTGPQSTAEQPRPASAGILAEAARADAEGEFQRALELLSDAAMKGDAEAINSLGHRLLTGWHTPCDPAKGVQLIEKAAQLGSPAAAARVAALAAIGMHVQQDWKKSIGALVFAAERGSGHAQAQLEILAEDRDLARSGEAGHTEIDRWAQLAQSINLNKWHQPAAGANLSESPLVRRFPEFIPSRFCDWLISQSMGRLERAKVYDALAKEQTVSETRNNTAATFDLMHTDVVSALTQVRICASTGVPFRHLEPVTVLHYDEGEQISEHYDFIDPKAPDYAREINEKGQRIVTFLIYLNDVYDHGETELIELGISHKGQKGEAMFFVNIDEQGDAEPRSRHAGRPPAAGEKWIVSQFIRNRPTF